MSRKIPSKETVIEAGAIIRWWCDDLDRRQALPQNRDGPQLFGKTAFLARLELLGDGCVIGALDERWLDDDFRSMIGQVLASDPPLSERSKPSEPTPGETFES